MSVLRKLSCGGILCSAILMSGCISQDPAKRAAQGYDPTVYSERGFIRINMGASGGVDEDKIDERTYVITSRTNPVTPVQQAVDLALVHAAKVGEANQFTHFQIEKEEVKLRCSSRNGGAPLVDMTVRYGREEDAMSGPRVHEVDAVLERLWEKVNMEVRSKYRDAETYKENMTKCESGGRFSRL